MTQQMSTSRRSVALASALVVLAVSAFGLAFYVYDGAGLIITAWDALFPAPVVQQQPAPVVVPELQLPDEMTEDFALRLWQEQYDSQRMIERLVGGEIERLDITGVEKDGDDARLLLNVTLGDGTKAPGVLGLRRFDGVYYIAYIAATEAGGPGDSPLPSKEEVDIAGLNTLLEQNAASAENVQEYVDGKIRSVLVEKVTLGPNTATISVEMDEDHETGYANLVAVREEFRGEPMWFLTRFEKTGSEPPKP